MKAPLSWLREMVEIDQIPLPELTRRLTMAGLEVEDVHLVGSAWRHVTIARITDLEPHPRADTLQVARVDLGSRTATVVSAAPNLRVGAVVPYVAPGGRLPSGEIGERAFRGITSQGMLCSGDELGISPDRDGIYHFEESAPVGVALHEYLAETVLDIYITPNRPDCMSIMGIAREIGALFGAPFVGVGGQGTGNGARPTPHTRHPTPATRHPTPDLVAVEIQDPIGCPRFTATVVEGVTIAPSPLHLQRRLHLAGVRPISNVVDVTNYVMLELGQPLHAFDRDRLKGGIVVRRAAPGERLKTLDGEQRTLTPAMLVVADASGARSLAGIMGGLDSEIGESTRDVVLEGASWDRATIRLTSAALNLSSEASRRFGRGVDPELTALAVSRAAAMTEQLAGGAITGELVDVYPGRAEPPAVVLNPARVNALLGTEIPVGAQVAALSALGFDVAATEGDTFVVQVPGHRRFDVEHVSDLAEEVARMVGYESIPTTTPFGRLPDPRPDGDAGYGVELRARRALAAAGLHEVITYSLSDPTAERKLQADQPWPSPDSPAPPPLAIANPQSREHSVLRGSLLPGLLQAAHTNLRLRDRVLLFELARTWHGHLDPLPREQRTVGILVSGPRHADHWSGESALLDFFDLKGVVDALFQSFRLHLKVEPFAHPALHPGRSASASLNGTLAGFLGELHPRVAERFDLEGQSLLVAELNFDVLLSSLGVLEDRVVSPSRFPSAERDIAVVVDESVAHHQVEEAIREAGTPLLQQTRLFDIYRADPIPPGRKSLAYALSYQAPDRTLEDQEVALAHARIEEALRTAFHADIRGRPE